MSSSRWIAAAVAALVVLECAPAGAATMNALTHNALTHNALAPEGSALADLNGVAVESVTLPQPAGALVADLDAGANFDNGTPGDPPHGFVF
jgi:hypothetical protein